MRFYVCTNDAITVSVGIQCRRRRPFELFIFGCGSLSISNQPFYCDYFDLIELKSSNEMDDLVRYGAKSMSLFLSLYAVSICTT